MGETYQGCNNELPRRKDKEDDLAFARRCHQAAKVMILGSHKRGFIYDPELRKPILSKKHYFTIFYILNKSFLICCRF